MEKKTVQAIIESLLFASGEALPVEKLCEILEISETELSMNMAELIDNYNYEKRGIKIIKIGNKYQMATRGEYADYIQKIVPPKKKNPLSKATLEVLTIIAYKQPVTRSTVSKVRGVDCDNSVSRLVEMGLIEEVGRLEAPGRPVLFGTTDEFLRTFAISDLSELEPLEDFVIEEISNAVDIEEQKLKDGESQDIEENNVTEENNQ